MSTKKRSKPDYSSEEEEDHKTEHKPKGKKQKREGSDSEGESPKLEKKASKKKQAQIGSPLSSLSDAEEKPQAKKSSQREDGSHEVYSLYFSGLPYETTEEQLQLFIGEDFTANIVDVKMPRWQDSGRCKGYAHVIFSSRETMEAVQKLRHKQRLGPRYIDIQLSKGRKDNEEAGGETGFARAENMPADCRVLFVKGLPYDFTEDMVGDRFRTFGKIEGIRMARNPVSNMFKGFCYIEFEEFAGAKKALQRMHNKDVNGRKIAVDFDVKGKPKEGYKPNFNSDGNQKYNRDQLKDAHLKWQRKENQQRQEEKARAGRPF